MLYISSGFRAINKDFFNLTQKALAITAKIAKFDLKKTRKKSALKIGRRYLQTTYLTKDLYLDRRKDSQNSTVKTNKQTKVN